MDPVRSLRVLLADVQDSDAEPILAALEADGWALHIRRASGSDELEDALLERGWEVVLFGGEGPNAVPARKALALVRLADPHLPFIAVTRSVRRHDLAAVVRGLDGGIAFAAGPAEVVDCLARELDQARQRRAEGKAHRLLLAQQAITDHVAAGLGAEGLLTRTLASLGETLGWVCGAVWLPDGDPARLRCAASWVAPDSGPAVAAFSQGSGRLRLAPGSGLPGRVFAFRRPAWVTDMRHDGQDPRSGAARHARLKGAIAVPLGSGDDCAGVLELFAHDAREHDAETATMLATLGGQLARALARERAVALHDPLTGLATSALLTEHVALALARARRSGASVMVLHLRLDAGQDLLATLAGRVIDVLRNTDVLARTGPSELGVLLADLRFGPSEVFERVGGRVVEALEEPLLLAGEEFRVQPTVGYATFPGESETAAELLAEAARSAGAKRRGPAPSGEWPTASSSGPGRGSSATTPLRSTKPSS